MRHSSAVTRVARTASLLTLLVASSQAAAQELPVRQHRLEFRVPSGALVASGAQRRSIKDARVTAVQMAWRLSPALAVTGTFGWARSRDLATIDAPKLDVFTSDIGLEARSRERYAGRPVSFSTFAGVGAGARSYNHTKLDTDATNNLAGYLGVGGELGVRRVALRLEARDYASGFKTLAGRGASGTRNDVMIMATVRFNRRAAAER
jgi:hypothetical protein